jgi:ATP-binding protein involved in chromosome partitioning
VVLGVLGDPARGDGFHRVQRPAVALFGVGGGEETASRLSTLVGTAVPLLGKVPFSTELRTGGDDGKPIVVADPDSPSAKAISEISAKLMVRSNSLLGVRLGLST